MILEEFLKVFEIDAEIDLESDTRKEYHGKIVDLIDSKDFKKFKNLFVIDVCLMIQFEKIKDVYSIEKQEELAKHKYPLFSLE